jgi:hypothetical protein
MSMSTCERILQTRVANKSLGKLDYPTGTYWKMAFGEHLAMGYLHHTHLRDEELHGIGHSSSIYGCF